MISERAKIDGKQLPTCANELEDAILLPLSGKNDIERIVQTHSLELIDFLDLPIEPFEEFKWKSDCFFCFNPKEKLHSHTEYITYILACYLYATRRSHTYAADVIHTHFKETFPLIPAQNVQGWITHGGPTGSFPNFMATPIRFEKRNPEAFDLVKTEEFFSQGFGTLLSICFTNISAHSRGIAGFQNHGKYVLKGHPVRAIERSQEEKLHDEGIIRSSKNRREIVNVLVARYLECLQDSQLIAHTLSLLPYQTMTEFLHGTFCSLRERSLAYKTKLPNFTSIYSTVRIAFLYEMENELRKRGFGNYISTSETADDFSIRFTGIKALETVIESLKKDIRRDTVSGANLIQQLILLTDIFM